MDSRVQISFIPRSTLQPSLSVCRCGARVPAAAAGKTGHVPLGSGQPAPLLTNALNHCRFGAGFVRNGPHVHQRQHVTACSWFRPGAGRSEGTDSSDSAQAEMPLETHTYYTAVSVSGAAIIYSATLLHVSVTYIQASTCMASWCGRLCKAPAHTAAATCA